MENLLLQLLFRHKFNPDFSMEKSRQAMAQGCIGYSLISYKKILRKSYVALR